MNQAQELCAACPKLCSFACPVSEQTGREAHTPWAKVSLLALASPPDASTALAAGACTGCLRCVHHCAHENDVPSLLRVGRAAAVRAGVAPQPWTSLAASFAISGHAEGGDLVAVLRALREDEPEAPEGAPLLFPGCDALAQGGKAARDALEVAARLGAPMTLVPDGALCCGLKLVEGGHPELHDAHTARLRALLVRPRTPVHLVFLQPGCARSVLEGWALPDGSKVEHVTTYLARALVKLPAAARPPQLPGSATFHDPCELARGLRETTAPRALLEAAFAGGVREPPRCGADASCCGAAGLLPRTLPAVAAAMAQAVKDEVGPGAVTASPACSSALAAEEVVSVLARWFSKAGAQ